MNAYAYNAELFCETCAGKAREAIIAEGLAPADSEDESSYDSDEFPKGPTERGGGEADSPQHCAGCKVFLENPLTTDGEDYVRKALADGSGDKDVLKQWAEFYGFRKFRVLVTMATSMHTHVEVWADDEDDAEDRGLAEVQSDNYQGDWNNDDYSSGEIYLSDPGNCAEEIGDEEETATDETRAWGPNGAPDKYKEVYR